MPLNKFQRITPCLWFDGQAEEAAKFYVSVFGGNSRILHTSYYGKTGEEIHGGKPGSVLTVSFELDGHAFTGLNGGPMFKFTEAVSLQIDCADQAEVDHFWARLGEGGDPAAQQCGWVKDRFGLSWQVVPRRMIELLDDPDSGRRERAFGAMMEMKKLDIAALEKAAEGEDKP